MPVSGRDAVRSQVIDVLEAQIKRRPATKKVTTAARKQIRNFSQPKLTITLGLGGRVGPEYREEDESSKPARNLFSYTSKSTSVTTKDFLHGTIST